MRQLSEKPEFDVTSLFSTYGKKVVLRIHKAQMGEQKRTMVRCIQIVAGSLTTPPTITDRPLLIAHRMLPERLCPGLDPGVQKIPKRRRGWGSDTGTGLSSTSSGAESFEEPLEAVF